MAMRIETLEARASKLNQIKDKLSARILALQAQEEQQIYEAVQKRPTAMPGGVGSPEYETRRTRGEAEKELVSAEANLAAVNRSLAEAREEEAGKQIKGLMGELKSWNAREAEVWKNAGELFRELHGLYGQLRTIVADKDRHFREAARTVGDANVQERVRELRHPFVSPGVKDWIGFLEKLNDASTDARAHLPSKPFVDLNSPRPEQPRVLRPLDDNDRLRRLIPLLGTETTDE